MEKQNKPRTYAFDFDGVLADYNGFVSASHTGEPNIEVVKAMRTLKEKGHTIIIHSTRGGQLLREYCAKHNIPFDFINENPKLTGENPGKPVASIYVDDRAVRYVGQSAEDLVSEIENFKAYWEK